MLTWNDFSTPPQDNRGIIIYFDKAWKSLFGYRYSNDYWYTETGQKIPTAIIAEAKYWAYFNEP